MAKYKVVFWENERKEKPVADWLRALSSEDRRYLGDIFYDLAMDGPHVRHKVFKHLEDALWEIRDLRKGAGYRIYFGFDGDVICIVVHAGDKGSQKRDIKLAKERLEKII